MTWVLTTCGSTFTCTSCRRTIRKDEFVVIDKRASEIPGYHSFCVYCFPRERPGEKAEDWRTPETIGTMTLPWVTEPPADDAR